MELASLDLNKLNTFLAVAEHGGVSAAARRLALTPSAVSQGLSGLEGSLGVRLFDRVGRRLVLTREGALLQRRLREYQDRLRATLAEIVNEEGEVRGVVRLGLYLGFPRARLAGLLREFTRRHPGASVRVVYGSQSELDASLLENRLDCALAFDPHSRAGGRLEATPLFEQELVLVAARRLLPERGRGRGGPSLEALAARPIVDYFRGDPLIGRWLAHHYPRRKPPPLDVRVWAATTNLVLDLVLAEVGMGVLPRFVAEPHLATARRGSRGRLVAIATGRPELRDTIWLKERPGTWRGATLEAFRAAVTDCLAEGAAEPARD